MRQTCPRCLRPSGFCLCEGCPPVASRTRVVLFQHPREARLAICSARMTRLALENAELHHGIRASEHPRLREVCAEPGTWLLYPAAGAVPAAGLADRPPRTLVVVDATWLQAEKMVRADAALAALPRVAVVSSRPSGYGELRREPAAHTLSTIEAVALALGAFEKDPERFRPMCEAFRRIVDRQLGCARGVRRTPRYRGPRPDSETVPPS